MKHKTLLRVAIFLLAIGMLAVLGASSVVAAPSDNFEYAMPITNLPYYDGFDNYYWGTQSDEPLSNCGGTFSRTAWYRYTSTSSASLSLSFYSYPYRGIVVYKGSSISDLSQVACRTFYSYDSSYMTFLVDPGTTYYFQLGTYYYWETSWMNFELKVTPPPSVSFYWNPSDPTIYDTIQFYDSSWDPMNMGFKSWSWNFADGSTSTAQNPIHRYVNDGDYAVKHGATTYDGRSASSIQVIRVRTHDVSIIKFTAPNAASVGQTKHVVVEVKNNTGYEETVQVQLLKSTATSPYPGPGGSGGYQIVGTLQQYVPPRSSNNTVSFDFSYTFTKDDSVMGKVTFKAIATLVNARDAIPADNEAMTLPVKVSK